MHDAAAEVAMTPGARGKLRKIAVSQKTLHTVAVRMTGPAPGSFALTSRLMPCFTALALRRLRALPQLNQAAP
ncbi:hypothetical protein D3C87_1624760 [compost metagenome]